MIKHLIIIISSIICFNTFVIAQNYSDERLDSIRQILRSEVPDSVKMKTYDNVLSYLYQTNPDDGIEYSNSFIELARKNKNKRMEKNAYVHLGVCYWAKSEYAESYSSYQKALDICDELNREVEKIKIYGNIGLLFSNKGDYEKATSFHKKAIDLSFKYNREKGLGNIYGNLGQTFQNSMQIDSAEKYYTLAIQKNIEDSTEDLNTVIYSNLGALYIQKDNITQGVEYLLKALSLSKIQNRKRTEAIVLVNLASVFNDKSQDTTLVDKERRIYFIESEKYYLEAIKSLNELSALRELQITYQSFAELYKGAGDYENSYKYNVKYQAIKDSIYGINKDKEIAQLEAIQKTKIQEKEIEMLEQENNFNLLVIIMSIIALFIVISLAYLIQKQRKLSEKLLYSILPRKIARRLKQVSRIADHYEDATVVFADMVSFTEYSKERSTDEIVKLLNELFTKFDEIAEKHNLEKIKTNGDAYIAVAGIPDPMDDHFLKALEFAKDLNHYVNNTRFEGFESIRFTIGLASGSIYAGVIGDKRQLYDIWGDTVNRAARMQETAERGKIQFAENFNELIKNKFTTEYRGEIAIQGIGNEKTYYLKD